MLNLLRVSLLGLFMWAGAAFAAPTGYIHAISGDVTIAEAGKSPVKAKLGDLFEQGASFTTGADGKATLKFADGQVVALAPNSQFVVTTYVYDSGNASSNNIVFSLARGGLRFVTGLIGQTNNSKFALRTPTMTAGVRGTDGIVSISPDGSTLVSVQQGVVSMTSPNGTVVLTLAGNYTFYPPNSTVPSATNQPVSNLPASATFFVEIVSLLKDLFLPGPSPVNVIDAAKEVIDAAATQSAPVVPGGPPPVSPGGSGGGGGSKS